MKTLNRLLQILALAGAGLSAAFFFLARDGDNEPSPAEKAANLQLLEREQAKSATIAGKLAALETAAAKAQDEARKLKSENVALAAQLSQLQRENLRFIDERAVRQATEEKLQAENARLTRQLAETEANSVPKQHVAAYETKVAALERTILDLKESSTRPHAAAPGLGSLALPENPSLTGSVLAVGKEASFVVLNIGYNDGVRLQLELVIQHGNAPIAKIQVTEVKENLSIARVLPESLLKTPQTGDSVTSFN